MYNIFVDKIYTCVYVYIERDMYMYIYVFRIFTKNMYGRLAVNDLIYTHVQNVTSLFAWGAPPHRQPIRRPGGLQTDWQSQIPKIRPLEKNVCTSGYSTRKPNPCNDLICHVHASESFNFPRVSMIRHLNCLPQQMWLHAVVGPPVAFNRHLTGI